MAKGKKKSGTKSQPAPGDDAKPSKMRPHAARRKARSKTKITKAKPREARKTPSMRAAWSWMGDTGQLLLPAVGGYAATRVIQRVVFNIVQKRWPKLGKWAHALSGVAAFGGVALLGHKVKQLEDYQDGVLIGAGVAAAQGVATAVLPKKYSWLLADCRPEDVVPDPQIPSANDPALQSGPATTAGGGDSYLQDELDAMEGSGSKQARTVAGPKKNSSPVASAMAHASKGQPAAVEDPDLDEMLADNESVDDLYTGSFAMN